MYFDRFVSRRGLKPSPGQYGLWIKPRDHYRKYRHIRSFKMSKYRDSSRARLPESEHGEQAEDPDLKATYPAIHEYLTEPDEDASGDNRTATLLFFAQDGVFKLCLNDRAVDATLWASGRSWEEAMLSLEVMLTTGAPPWRIAPKSKGRRRN